MSHKTGFYEGRLGIGLANDGGDGTGNPRFPLDVNGDIRLTGAILKANGEKYLGGLTKIGFDNMTELQNGNIGVGTETPTVLFDISGNTKISGDLNIIGTLQMNGQTPTYSNWTNSGDDIFRDSGVTIGQNSVNNTSYKLYVNGDTHINGTLSATTLSGSLPYTSLTGTPTTITNTQAGNITTNNAKVSSQWVTGSSSKIYYNDGNVGIGTTSPNYELSFGESATTTDWTNGKGMIALFEEVSTGNYFYGIGVGSSGSSINSTGGLAFWGGTGGNAPSNSNAHLFIKRDDGNIGIGTTSPNYTLQITDSGLGMGNGIGGTALFGYKSLGTTSSSSYTRGHEFLNANGDSMMCILHYGTDYTNPKVGIGTTGPIYPLDIGTHVMPYYVKGIGTEEYTTNSFEHLGTYNWDGNYHATYIFSARFAAGIAVMGNYIVLASDTRIKQNIVDVPDNLALETLRSIPVRYYEYIDKLERGSNKTIGFIAQEVKEHLPEAVVFSYKIIPNEMRMLENTLWEEIIDGSNNTYKLTTDLNNCSGIKYRFYVSNDISGNDEVMKEVVGNSDNSFTFDQSWNNVFCYGKEVDDFHTLDKNKLYTINFSATQELDRKVTSLETENETIKKEIQAIKQENETIKQENETIKQENEDLKFQMALLRSELTTIKAHLGI